MTPSTQERLQPVIAIKDDSGHWYVIPGELHDEWIRLNEDMDSDGQATFEAAEDKSWASSPAHIFQS